MREPVEAAMLVPGTAQPRRRSKGDPVRRMLFSAYLSWLLVFGGSPVLLRRLAVGGAAA